MNAALSLSPEWPMVSLVVNSATAGSCNRCQHYATINVGKIQTEMLWKYIEWQYNIGLSTFKSVDSSEDSCLVEEILNGLKAPRNDISITKE